MHGLGKSGFHKVAQEKIRPMLLWQQAEMLGIPIIQIKPLVFFPIAVALKKVSHSLLVCLPACLSGRILHHIIQLHVSLSTFPLAVCSSIVFSSTNHEGHYSRKYKVVIFQFIIPQHCQFLRILWFAMVCHSNINNQRAQTQNYSTLYRCILGI